jgi:hypothetical protein
MAKSAIKIIDKDFERIYHNLTNKNDNLNNTFSKSFNSNKLYPIENNTYYKTINIQNKYQINNENSNENVNLKTLSDENKNQFENNVVSQIENQQNNILNKENNILNKDNNKSDNLENIIEKKKQIKNILFNN